MLSGLPGGSSGGGPISTCGFWFVIGCTTAVLGAFVWFLFKFLEPF